MAGDDLIEIKFRLFDGTDIGPNKYDPSGTVGSLKENILSRWPQDKGIAPKTINDIKLINAGKILDNNRTLAESRVPVGELPGGVITMHVVVRPPLYDRNNDLGEQGTSMGSFLSLPLSRPQMGEQSETSQIEARKRLRMSSGYYDEKPRIIPSLPDEISLQVLARLPRICYLSVKSVSQSWKAAITSREVFQLRKELGTREEWLYILTKLQGNSLLWLALDPLSRKWQKLPLVPLVVHEEEPRRGLFRFRNVMGSSIKMADVIRGWLGWKDALDQIPFRGCAVGVVDGCLYVLGGFAGGAAVKSVWRYDTRMNIWEEVSSMATGRAFCKTGLFKNKLYVVGGVSRGRGGLTPLRSAEVFDPNMGLWTQLPSMLFSKALDLPTAFLADMLKPIATGMTTYKGRLCVPQSLYTWPFFIDIGGEIYDPETDSWVEMPAGMGDGWPARQAGTKLSVVVDDKLYALELSSSMDSGKIKIYDEDEDVWKVVIPTVPLCDFADSESPYLLAGLLGKVHVITKYTNNDIAVLQADLEKPKCSCSSASSPPSHSTSSPSSSPSTSSPPSTSSSVPPNSTPEKPGCSVEEDTDLWKIIASKNFGEAEIVSCQVLDL